ncbi:YcnI family protein, partial [Mycolicibacterium insubricum]|uniref:YcnI family protein n=1 Tax=Mycolicibacterium insubricum TaxID=444597 RepID=UPI0021F36B5D
MRRSPVAATGHGALAVGPDSILVHTGDMIDVHVDAVARTVREPVAGWTLDIQKRKIDPPLRKDDGTPVNEVVSTVTWTAAPGG